MTRILWTGGGLFALAGLVLYNGSNPNPVRYTAITCLLILAGIIWAIRGAILSNIAVMFGVFLGYACLSLLWSPDWRGGMDSLYEMTLFLGVVLLAMHVNRERLGKAIPFIASAAVFISFSLNDPQIFGGYGNKNFQAEFLCLAIPMCLLGLVTWRKSLLGALCLIAALLALFILVGVNEANTKWAGLGGLLAFVAFRRRRIAVPLMVVGFAVVAFRWDAPLQTSILQRVELSYNTLLMWLDYPTFGVGIGGFNPLYPLYQERHLALFDGNTVHSLFLYAGATHNEFVQALAVFGLVGSAIILGILWTGFRHRHHDILASFGFATLATMGGLSLVGFPFQNPATATMAAAAFGLVASSDRFSLRVVLWRIRGAIDYCREPRDSTQILVQRRSDTGVRGG